MYCSTNFHTRMYMYILEDVQLSGKAYNLSSQLGTGPSSS